MKSSYSKREVNVVEEGRKEKRKKEGRKGNKNEGRGRWMAEKEGA